jgi:hypothetical protein
LDDPYIEPAVDINSKRVMIDKFMYSRVSLGIDDVEVEVEIGCE